MAEILQKDAPVLHQEAPKVTEDIFGSDELRKDIATMKKALESQEDGVAIAAPQVGISKRIFIVSHRVFAEDSATFPTRDLVFINPIITKTSQKTKNLEEGCLSVRGVYGTVPRAERVVLSAKNEVGEDVTLEAEGFLAQIFQHETDHLDGILFTEKATELFDTPTERHEEKD